MANEQLPQGQIQPQARPVNTFFQLQPQAPVAPAKPLEMPAPKGISAIGTGGTGGFQTPNGYTQLVQALAPFSKQFMETATALGEAYAGDQYQKGLNEALKANRLLQGQVEQSADAYAADNRKLARKDPPAALLMDSMNPYRRGGIQAGLAQMAASDVEPYFLRKYQDDRMRLAELPAGSTEVAQFQAERQQEVLKYYGLDTSMPAVQKYFVPKANKAWERLTELQWDDSQKYLKSQTPLLIVGEVSGLMRNAQAAGVVSGFDQRTGAPVNYSLRGDSAERARAEELLSAQASAVFDKHAKRMGLPGEAIDVVKKAWDELWGGSLGEEARAATQGRVVDNTLMRTVLAQVQVGAPIKGEDGVALRPLAAEVWGKSAVDDLLKYDSAKYEARERQRKSAIDSYEADLAAATMGLAPGPELQAAIDGVGQKHPEISASDKAVAQTRMIPKIRELASYGMDRAAPQQLLNDLDQMPLVAFDPKEAAQRLQEMLPNVPDDQKEGFLKDGQSLIRRRTEDKGKFDPLVGKAVEKAVVKELAERYPTSILEMSRGGKPVDIYALRSNANGNLRQAAFLVESGLMKHVQNRLLEKGQQLGAMTAPQKQAVIDGAIEEYTNGKYFEKLFPGVSGNANANGTPSQAPAAKAPQARAVYQGAVYSSSQLKNLGDGDLKGYNRQPLLSEKSIRSELEGAANGRGFSGDLQSAARRAGVTPLRMLEEQLKFYPGLQIPKPMMDDIRRRERSDAGRRAAAQQATSYNPLTGAPMVASAARSGGNWLMNLLVPPAAAATLPPSYSRYQGGSYGSYGGGGQEWQSRDRRGQSLILMAQRNGWNPADLAAIISFETGGTLNPVEPGRGAAAGRVGLIQAGPNERAAYGLGTGDWNKEILGIERYLKDRGAKPGMGLADLYATVNGGNPRAGYTEDGNGTVARSPQTLRALERHRQQALNRLGMSQTTGGSGGSLSGHRQFASSITYDTGQPGIDIYFEHKKVPAVLSGRVKDIGFQGGPGQGYGHYLVIESTDPTTGRQVDVLYGHLPSRPTLAIGAPIRAGQVIGRQGGSGRVKSVDGTITSIDFLAPRPRGSTSMTPYSGYDRLRRRVAQQLGG